MIKLIASKNIDKEMYESYVAAWILAEDKMVPYSALQRKDSFQEQLKLWAYEETDGVRESGFVPSELYFLTDETQILGAIHLRLELNDSLKEYGGHIGYGVHPENRRKGYAKIMMEMMQPILKAHKLERVLLTCDADNEGSKKTITGSGGVLKNQIMHDGVLVNRYWIEV